jgi:hypothetical protein
MSPSTIIPAVENAMRDLFEDKFKLHVLEQAHDFPFPRTLAYLDGIGESSVKSG